jgi:hypothetical protein
MNPPSLQAGDIDRHLRTMRLTTVAFLLTVPAAAAVFVLAPARDGAVPPLAVSLTAAAAALWVGFTANRDAQARLDRIKRAFAARGDEQRLLRDHRIVNLAVLARLEVMIVAAVVASIWGGSSAVAWGVLVLAGAMMCLSWPTADKTDMLIQRARDQRGR